MLCLEFYKHPKTTKLNFNTTKEEGDGSKLPSPSLIEHHHKRRQWHIVTLSFFFLLLLRHKKKATIACCHHLFCSISTIDDVVFFFFFSNTKKTKHTKKQQKKTKRREGVYFQAPALPSHFWLLLLPFCFKHFLLASSSSQAEEKKCREGSEPAHQFRMFSVFSSLLWNSLWLVEEVLALLCLF